MDPNSLTPEEADRQWAAYLAWHMEVPEPTLARLDGPLDYWRQAGEPLVTAADAAELAEWFLL